MAENNSSRGWIIGLAIVVAVAIGAYFFLTSAPEPEIPPVVSEPEPEPEPKVDLEPEPEPETADTGEQEPAAEPERELPPLNESDEAVRKDLLSLAPDGALGRWLVSDEVIRKWVAAVNAASSGQMMAKNRPYNSPPGSLVVEKEGATGMVLSEENYQRYDTPVRLLANMNNDAAMRLYRFWYPRLAEAFAELGMQDKTFHDQVLKAIDVALDAPEVDRPIQLVRPSVYYKFADPKLEKLPGVHKLMIRLGPDNAGRVKAKLRELQSELQQFQPPRQ
ncbi:DUF3014 domain-containing protein [Microbulbifer yueqingensis]|uniref:DUF3014 domain-containing protein n=1 Tax=Microbulbifer yueqingensis TaxID=658219 RepID=A0A1G8Y9E9_9GAMM|nr:DUF3014 domain-containing protein [Microbulbifer yueqingensis]SDJ99044.1 Protein of unknown function [Microbulbifer yueqingensis]